MLNAFLVILALALLKYFFMFVAPYLVYWKIFPEKFNRFKIQSIERQRPQLFHEITYSLSTIFIQSLLVLSIYWGVQKNFFHIYLGFGSEGYLKETVGYFIYFFIYDAYFYWSHRFLHIGWLYKNVHVVHHRSQNPTPFAAYSFHPIEAVINMLYFYPILYFFPMSLELLLLLVLMTDFGNLGGHLGYDFLPKKMWNSWWGSWLTTPTHHNLHHQFSCCNYGLYWRGWDEIFKTLHVRTESEFYRVKDQH